jgi:hypothetical protein
LQKNTDSTKKFSETDIINMLEFLIDNIFVIFGGRVFQQTVGIPMGTNCAPLLANLFIYSYDTDRLLLSANKRSRENNSRFQDSRFQPQTHKMNPTKKKNKKKY